MTTLIHCHGAIEGRCDAKCYNAKSEHCDCICGGLNHGAGRQAAIDNTRRLTKEHVAEIERRGGYIADEVRQLGMLS